MDTIKTIKLAGFSVSGKLIFAPLFRELCGCSHLSMYVSGEYARAETRHEARGQQEPFALIINGHLPFPAVCIYARQWYNLFPTSYIMVISAVSLPYECLYELERLRSHMLICPQNEQEMEDFRTSVRHGRPYISRCARKILKDGGVHHKKRFDMLSPREQMAATYLIEGKSMKEMASDLNLSVSTVATYRKRCKEKMGMQNSSDFFRNEWHGLNFEGGNT